MTSLEDRLERIEKKLDMLLARQQGGAQAASRRLQRLLGAPFLSSAPVSSSRCANHS